MPPDADTVFRAELQRLLAARWGVAPTAPRVVWVGRLLWRVLLWADRQPAGAALALTLAVSAEGRVTTYGGAADPNALD